MAALVHGDPFHPDTSYRQFCSLQRSEPGPAFMRSRGGTTPRRDTPASDLGASEFRIRSVAAGPGPGLYQYGCIDRSSWRLLTMCPMGLPWLVEGPSVGPWGFGETGRAIDSQRRPTSGRFPRCGRLVRMTTSELDRRNRRIPGGAKPGDQALVVNK